MLPNPVMVPVAMSGVVPEDWLMPEPPLPHATATIAMTVARRNCLILSTLTLLDLLPEGCLRAPRWDFADLGGGAVYEPQCPTQGNMSPHCGMASDEPRSWATRI